MFVPFSSFLGHLEFLVFRRKWGGGDKPYTKAVKQDVVSQFFKSTTKVKIFFKEAPAIFTKK